MESAKFVVIFLTLAFLALMITVILILLEGLEKGNLLQTAASSVTIVLIVSVYILVVRDGRTEERTRRNNGPNGNCASKR